MYWFPRVPDGRLSPLAVRDAEGGRGERSGVVAVWNVVGTLLSRAIDAAAAPMAVALALLIATGTAGFGFFLLPVYWIAVMVHVWAIPDRIDSSRSDEGEQY